MRGQAHFTNLATNPATQSLAASWRVPDMLWQQNRAAGNLSDLVASSHSKSCYKPCHRESGCCFLKSSRQARAAEQSCWQSFGSSGKLTFQVLLQPCHRELGCFLKSSRQALAAEQSCWQTLGSSGKLTFLILLQALPQRAWLLLGEFQTCSGSRTELLGIFRILGQARIPSLATTLPQRAWLLLEEFQAGPGNRTDLLGCSGKLTWFLWLLHGWLLSARFLPKAPCQKLLAKSSLPKAPCCHRVGQKARPGGIDPLCVFGPRAQEQGMWC